MVKKALLEMTLGGDVSSGLHGFKSQNGALQWVQKGRDGNGGVLFNGVYENATLPPKTPMSARNNHTHSGCTCRLRLSCRVEVGGLEGWMLEGCKCRVEVGRLEV